jgi:uncharacterized protein
MEKRMLDAVPTPPPSVRIKVVVSPRACGDEVLGWTDGALKIRVAAAGRKGRADAAVETLLAEVLGLPRDRVRVVAGRGTRRKWIEIDNYDEKHLERQLPGRYASQEPMSPPGVDAASAVQPASLLRRRRAAPPVRRSTTH